MRNAATKAVYEIAQQNPNVLALTADSTSDYYLNIRAELKDQFLDYGIAEANIVASAAGLASCGKIPFLFNITNFMSMRAFEFLRNDVCVASLNVNFLGRSAGLASSYMGLTHQGTDELPLLRVLPNLLTITPATPMEARLATFAAYEHVGPTYLRLEGVNEPELYDASYKFETGKGVIVHKGSDITIISTGSIVNEAVKAAEYLKKHGVSMQIINIHTIKPLDEEIIIKAALETEAIITLEEHTVFGGLGTAVAEVLALNHLRVKFAMMGLRGFAEGCGTRAQMRELNGLSYKDIFAKVNKLLKEKII